MSAQSKGKRIRVSLVKSPIGARPVQRATVRALGLRRMNSAVVREATPSVLGMLRVVSHLVRVEEVS